LRNTKTIDLSDDASDDAVVVVDVAAAAVDDVDAECDG